MAVSFFTRTTKDKGDVPLFVRLQSKKQHINHKACTPLTVDIQAWNNSKEGATQMRNFRRANKALVDKMNAIADALELSLEREQGLTQEEFKQIVNEVVYQEAREAKKRRDDAKAAAEAEAKRVKLNQYIDNFLDQIKTGERQTAQGKEYARSTVIAVRQAMTQFKLFQKESKRTLDYKDINMAFYHDYTAFLKNKNYSINSVGKCIRQLKAIMNAAESEGYHSSNAWKDKRFKGTRVEVDSIYLTREDLDKLMSVDFDGLSEGHRQARDIFMVGVWTAQRISDYNHIKKEDFTTFTRNVMREAPDPDKPGSMMAWIEQEDITYLTIRQQKTGAKVTIPCNSELKSILERYDYQMPHLEDQVINRYIKDVAKAAGINDSVVIETTKGGKPEKKKYEKWELVHSHTARRTGATLMYLAGVDVYDIMKVTGHTTPKMLKKYIKADSLEVAEKLTDKYNYFK